MQNVANLINITNTKNSGIHKALSPLNSSALINPFVPARVNVSMNA